MYVEMQILAIKCCFTVLDLLLYAFSRTSKFSSFFFELILTCRKLRIQAVNKEPICIQQGISFLVKLAMLKWSERKSYSLLSIFFSSSNVGKPHSL